MKPLSIIYIIAALMFAPWWGISQTAFKHTVTTSNTPKHISKIQQGATNGKSNMILIVTHDHGSKGPYQKKAFGVWYNGSQWSVYNEGRVAIAANTTFNVLAVPKGNNAFVHAATPQNSNGNKTKLDHPALNGKPNARLLITHNWGNKGPYHPHPTGVFYSGGHWYIYNMDGKAIPEKSRFNVVVDNRTFLHQAKTENTKDHISYIDHASTNGKKDHLVFATFNGRNSIKMYNTPIGVWYSSGKWAVYNEDRAKMKRNEAFNILSVKGKASNTKVLVNNKVLINKPVVVKKDTAKRTLDVRGLKDVGLVRYRPFTPATEGTTASEEPLGPNLELPEDINNLLDSPDHLPLLEKLNVFRNLYKDKNSKINRYYYLPSSYTLKWDAASGEYFFYIYYMSAGDNPRGSVLVKAELTPQIGREEISLLEDMLSKKQRKHIELRPMFLRDVPKIDLGATLTNFNIEAESIHASIPSDFHQPLIVDWKMESNIDDFVGAMLNNIGINMNLEFRPAGDEETLIAVPVNLQVNSATTYGKLPMKDVQTTLERISNNTDYPIILTEVNVLRERANRSKYFEKVALPEQEVAPGADYTLKDLATKEQLNSGDKVKAAWVSYSLNRECSECDQNVKRKIIGGTSGSRITNLDIQVLNPLEYSQAHSMKLLIRSIQADPNGVLETTFPAITIEEDDSELEAQQLFVPEGESLNYQYQLLMIMPDGKVHESSWKHSDTALLVIGESQIKELFKDKEKDEAIEEVKDSLIKKGKKLLEGLLGGDDNN